MRLVQLLEGPGLPDLESVDKVARLALVAAHLGGHIALQEVSGAMQELLDLAGLVLEVPGQPEGGEEPFGP